MNWLTQFLQSSIGQKLVVGVTGLWLILFLTIHVLGNSQLFIADGGVAFNHYAHLMENNPVIIYFARYLTLCAFLLHAFKGLLLARANSAAKGAVEGPMNKRVSIAARYAAYIGSIIFIFLVLHLAGFWWRLMVSSDLPMQDQHGEQVVNLYLMVETAFQNPLIVLFYVFAMVILGFHLQHGFQSAFQTFGLNHQKYTPLIQLIGTIFSVLVPVLFAFMPIFFYLGLNKF